MIITQLMFFLSQRATRAKMFAQLLLVLGVGISGFVTASPVIAEHPVVLADNATCKYDPPITPCVTGFFANLGFAGQNNGYPKNDSIFIMALHNYLMTNDVAGWNNLRTWMNTFITCAGGHANFDLCLDYHILMNLCHLPMQAAIEYETQFRVLEYETGAGFDVITHNWFCIKGVDQHEGPVIQMCRQHFQDQQHNNPNMTCQHLGELLNCIERPYVQHCGRQVGMVLCHVERLIYSIVNPDCASHVALHCGGGAENPIKKLTQRH